ncbi:HAD family hydrolase [Prauserella oleivorans]|uniref:HAD family hydrolase n=1 Tax=Prauserella oleivorans TaxID=1478153 RepID=A0ABW5W7P1_9PSEU
MAFALGSPTAPQTVSDHEDAAPWAPPELRLVCLDIDDTLIDFSAAGRRSLAALIGRADMWSEWERITDEHVARVVSGDLGYADMHVRRTQAFLAALGITADHGEALAFETRRKELLRRSWRLFDDVLPCLDWLVAAGVQLAAVTNASGAHQREKLATLGLARFFDHVAIAGEVGVAKPDPVMFHSVCFQLGCDPSEAVHVGDKLRTDALGARDAGLGGVWLNRGQVAAEVPPGVHVLSSLSELPQLLVSEFVRVGVPAQR